MNCIIPCTNENTFNNLIKLYFSEKGVKKSTTEISNFHYDLTQYFLDFSDCDDDCEEIPITEALLLDKLIVYVADNFNEKDRRITAVVYIQEGTLNCKKIAIKKRETIDKLKEFILSKKTNF